MNFASAWADLETAFLIKLASSVEHAPQEQNSRGCGFDTRWVLLGFFLFLSLRGTALIRSIKEVQSYRFPYLKK